MFCSAWLLPARVMKPTPSEGASAGLQTGGWIPEPPLVFCAKLEQTPEERAAERDGINK